MGPNSSPETSSHCWWRPFTCTASQGKVTDWATKPPALYFCHPALTKEFLKSSFNQWAEICPFQSELCNHILICICTDQLEYLILTNQDHNIWTNQSCMIWITHLHRNGPIRTRAGTFSVKDGLPFVYGECTFGFLQRLHFSGLQILQLNKGSLFSPQVGDICGQNLFKFCQPCLFHTFRWIFFFLIFVLPSPQHLGFLVLILPCYSFYPCVLLPSRVPFLGVFSFPCLAFFFLCLFS